MKEWDPSIEVDQDDLIYLASPYSHPDPAVRQMRFEKVCEVAAEMMRDVFLVFSPIAHTHPIAVSGTEGLPKGWEFWERYDRRFLKSCDKLVVLKIDGWQESKGVQAEIKIAQEMSLPVEYITVKK